MSHTPDSLDGFVSVDIPARDEETNSIASLDITSSKGSIGLYTPEESEEDSIPQTINTIVNKDTDFQETSSKPPIKTTKPTRPTLRINTDLPAYIESDPTTEEMTPATKAFFLPGIMGFVLFADPSIKFYKGGKRISPSFIEDIPLGKTECISSDIAKYMEEHVIKAEGKDSKVVVKLVPNSLRTSGPKVNEGPKTPKPASSGPLALIPRPIAEKSKTNVSPILQRELKEAQSETTMSTGSGSVVLKSKPLSISPMDDNNPFYYFIDRVIGNKASWYDCNTRTEVKPGDIVGTLYAHVGILKDEISICRGWVIRLEHIFDDGWGEGTIISYSTEQYIIRGEKACLKDSGKSGMFPLDCIFNITEYDKVADLLMPTGPNQSFPTNVDTVREILLSELNMLTMSGDQGQGTVVDSVSIQETATGGTPTGASTSNLLSTLSPATTDDTDATFNMFRNRFFEENEYPFFCKWDIPVRKSSLKRKAPMGRRQYE